MRYAAILLLLCACRAPDRWQASVARGEGSADSPKVDFDTEETTLELGVSGPLWSAPDRRYPVMPAWTPPPAVVAPAPAPEATTDWVALSAAVATAVTGALAAVRYLPSKTFEGPFDKKKPEAG